MLIRRAIQGGMILAALTAAGGIYPARATTLCGSMAPPSVSVIIRNGAVAFDTFRSMAELATLRIDTASPWPAAYHTGVGGVMQGIISTNHRIDIHTATDKKSGRGCLWIDRVEVTLHLNPKIYIAHELRTQECHFRNVFEHEAKHLDEDRALLEKYRTVIAQGLDFAFAAPDDYAVGPIAAAGMDSARTYMETNVARTLEVMIGQMMRERARRQQAIDSLGEYISVSGGC